MSTCSDCPSYMPSGDAQQEALGTSLGVPVCARLGIVLGAPGASNEQYRKGIEERANACTSYGDPFEWQPVSIREFKPAMFKPNPVLVANRHPAAETVRSCVQCDNYIAPGDAFAAYGVNSGICAAQGALITERSQQPLARVCEMKAPRSGGPMRTGLELLPDIDPMAHVAIVNMQRVAQVSNLHDKHAGDPNDYVSDRPVTPAEQRAFIKAIRWVEDPEGIHDPIELPIFDGPALCAHYKVDECAVWGKDENDNDVIVGYDPALTYGNFSPDLYLDHMGLLYDLAAEFIVNEKVPYLIGPAGTGKSEAAAYMARKMNLPLHFISIDKGTEPWMLMGQAGLVDSESGTHNVTTYEEGSLSRWIEWPAVIMIDEPNVRADIFMTLRSLTGAAREIMVNGRRRQMGSYTFLMFSGNPDWLPEYVGTEMLSAAELERIVPIYVDVPPEPIERQIVIDHCAASGYEIPEVTLDHIMQIGRDIRGQIEKGTLPIAWGVRSQIKVALATRTYSIQKAYRRAITDGLEPGKVDVINPLIATVVG